MPQERLQKILARAGIAARRKAEDLILDGRVAVNNEIVAELGVKADPFKDSITVDGRRVTLSKPVYFIMNKPRGMLTTMDDPEKRSSVGDIARRFGPGVFPVGRLDYNSSGALMLTNDGEMAQALSHPKFMVPRVYHVKVKGNVTKKTLDRWRRGIRLDRGEIARSEVFVLEAGPNAIWLEVELKQGMNRQIHRMAENSGLKVSKLKRVSFAGLTIEGLSPGEARNLTQREISKLKRDFLNPSKRQKRKDSRRVAQEAAERFGDNGSDMGMPGLEEQIGALPKRKIHSKRRGVVKVVKDRSK